MAPSKKRGPFCFLHSLFIPQIVHLISENLFTYPIIFQISTHKNFSTPKRVHSEKRVTTVDAIITRLSLHVPVAIFPKANFRLIGKRSATPFGLRISNRMCEAYPMDNPAAIHIPFLAPTIFATLKLIRVTAANARNECVKPLWEKRSRVTKENILLFRLIVLPFMSISGISEPNPAEIRTVAC